MKHYFQLHFITNCNWLNRPKELWYCSTPNTSHTVFFTIAHVTTATQDSRFLANKDTLHNRDSKGMSVYMESEYSYLQEGFLFITILNFHSNKIPNTFVQCLQVKAQARSGISFGSSHCACTEGSIYTFPSTQRCSVRNWFLRILRKSTVTISTISV